jgi:hypothetical protein
MKRKVLKKAGAIIAGLAAVFAGVLLLGGCDFLISGITTPQARLDAFQRDLNASNRSAAALQRHLHPSCSRYSELAAGDPWNTLFPKGKTWSFDNRIQSGMQITGQVRRDGSTVNSFTFTFEEQGGEVFIRRYSESGGKTID